MTNRLMISVAALALFAGTGFANAQGTGMGREAPSAAPAQQSEPAEHGAAPARGNAGGQINRDAARPAMKSTQTEQKPGAVKNQSAEENTQAPNSSSL